jgi:hypothetical protein
MKLIQTVTAVILLAVATASFAAKPTSIAFKASGEASNGKPYAEYQVKCSDGKKLPLTAWDNRRKWCVGEVESTQCEKKQIKAAKAACSSGISSGVSS